MSKSELYDLLAYLDLEQYEKVVPEIEKKDEEIERLNNIIKEVRETTEKESFTYEHIAGDYRAIESDLILEILDKVGSDKE